MYFSFLGPLTVTSNRSRVYLSGDRGRRLLAALVVNANCPVSTEKLIDIVWDDQPPITARRQLQNRLGRLRAFLPTDNSTPKIVRQGSNYILEVPEDHVDGLHFRRLCAEAESARQNTRNDLAVTLLRRGLSLWRGDALQDVSSSALQADAIRWQEHRLRAIEHLVELEFTRGNRVNLIHELQYWVTVHPYHEALHCRLAEALHEASRTAESLAVLRSLRGRLGKDLGITAGVAVTEVERRIHVDGQTASEYAGIHLDQRATEALHRALSETSNALKLLTMALS
ncbi:AfsR/SARP family transcriptional regulator [Micromonospora sp. WMMD723]|uniref:AfsR/SARP family transcriptional regulator n=1 Tax=Micromonospora sp. WMMD723 TaxID=3403465 RepID=UPI003CEEDF03